MRSPVIAFGIFAATVSPTLVGAAPTSPNLPGAGAVTSAPHAVPIGGATSSLPTGMGANPIGFLPTGGVPSARKRANDIDTAGGNARTGNTNSSDGGSVVNDSDLDTTQTNDGSSEYLTRWCGGCKITNQHCRCWR